MRENSRWNLHENFGARQDPASKDLIVEIRISRGGKLRLTNFAELTNESTLRESGLALSLRILRSKNLHNSSDKPTRFRIHE